MAAKLLLPGMGGKYTSENLTDTDTVAADTIDCSRCASVAIQTIAVSGSPAGTIQMEQSFDGTNWVTYGSTLDVSANNVGRFDITDGPIGLLRINPTGITPGGVSKFIIVGWPVMETN